LSRRKKNTAALARGRGVGGMGVEQHLCVSKSTTARRRNKHRPRRPPPGFLLAREAINGTLPPMTRLECRAFARELARVRLQDEQRRRERGYATS
jgi:hypothetical protein